MKLRRAVIAAGAWVAPLLGGERGLKLKLPGYNELLAGRSSLRRGAWVETHRPTLALGHGPVAPLLGGERGLKHLGCGGNDPRWSSLLS